MYPMVFHCLFSGKCYWTFVCQKYHNFKMSRYAIIENIQHTFQTIPQFSSSHISPYSILRKFCHFHFCSLTALISAHELLCFPSTVSKILRSVSKLYVIGYPPTSMFSFPMTPPLILPLVLLNFYIISPLMQLAKKYLIPNVASSLTTSDISLILLIPPETHIVRHHITEIFSGSTSCNFIFYDGIISDQG